ncbi:MAG: DUF934 domain-containing protein [Methylococcaceae bacterium]|jgi:uncharacterized protein (DUF934 family)
MQIIKNQQIIDDTWLSLADDDAIKTGDICISLSRWQQDKAQLINHQGLLGVQIEPTEVISDIAADLGQFAMVAINFPVFSDGRGFSHAQMLSGQYGYTGEIRAVGQFMVEQVFYLSRVGFNSFCLANPAELPGALASLNDFSVSYQLAV